MEHELHEDPRTLYTRNVRGGPGPSAVAIAHGPKAACGVREVVHLLPDCLSISAQVAAGGTAPTRQRLPEVLEQAGPPTPCSGGILDHLSESASGRHDIP